jgi:predicted PurR-regulated permease PerM
LEINGRGLQHERDMKPGNQPTPMCLGIFLAAQPTVYREVLLLLVPSARRERVRAVLNETGETLRHWLLGHALTMSAVFLFTLLGLWLVGVKRSFALGVQAVCSPSSRQ